MPSTDEAVESQPVDLTKITTAEEWHSPRVEGFPVQLPSGNVARVRRTMDLMVLLKAGKIPNPLAQKVQEMIDQGKVTLAVEDMDQQTIEQLGRLQMETVAQVLVSPRCMIPPEDAPDPSVWEPPPGCISTYDLTPEDLAFLWNIAQGGTTDLESFRELTATFVAASQNGGHVPQPTKRTTRAKKKK